MSGSPTWASWPPPRPEGETTNDRDFAGPDRAGDPDDLQDRAPERILLLRSRRPRRRRRLWHLARDRLPGDRERMGRNPQDRYRRDAAQDRDARVEARRRQLGPD